MQSDIAEHLLFIYEQPPFYDINDISLPIVLIDAIDIISTLYCITLLLCGCIFNVKVLQDTWNDLPNRQFLELKQLFPEIYDNKVHQPLKYEIVQYHWNKSKFNRMDCKI